MAKKRSGSNAWMLKEDYSAPANLPQDWKYTSWPKTMSYESDELDDTITGVDKQMNSDVSAAMRGKSKRKY